VGGITRHQNSGTRDPDLNAGLWPSPSGDIARTPPKARPMWMAMSIQSMPLASAPTTFHRGGHNVVADQEEDQHAVRARVDPVDHLVRSRVVQ
ncbi:hypothetical protein, partial [Actinomadura sp. HBU206391]|uniref:hypothetical protein n=1 Tax=Actinomadura sp. HBU206391 TaxID=2731692 RepID=UPI001C9C20F2